MNCLTAFQTHDIESSRTEKANYPASSQKLTRRAHTKVRTGCLTCKIRRKKCDETKPSCRRCTSTVRKCDGYGTYAPSVSSSKTETIEPYGKAKAISTLSLTDCGHYEHVLPDFLAFDQRNSCLSADLHSYGITTASTNLCSGRSQHTRSEGPSTQSVLIRFPISLSTTDTITDLERHCFSYFRVHTGPQLSSYFSSTLWQRYCTSLGFSHHVVFACAAALGAVHRRFNLGISKEALQWCSYSDSLVRNAQRLLRKFERNIEDQTSHSSSHLLTTAATSHAHSLSQSGTGDNDIAMTSHMLLSLFGTFQADYPAAVHELKVGIRYLLARPMRLL